MPDWIVVSIHATLAGGDNIAIFSSLQARMFLSTPPSRVATSPVRSATVTPSVSIHATLAGGDRRQRADYRRAVRFYPRHPRGWRLRRQRRLHVFNGVSIHATLAGGDLCRTVWAGSPTSFYPRHPRGWRLNTKVPSTEQRRFYPRHPRGWRPRLRRFPRRPPYAVSIHATLAGGDRSWASITLFHLSFYPRHPRGWRRSSFTRVFSSFKFLSTPPSRVATSTTVNLPMSL